MGNSYTLDRRDRIVAVGPDWDRFAEANDGFAARAEAVIGRPLFNEIAGDASRMYMQAILMRVRASGAIADAAYRCDGPEVKRYFRMRVSPLPDLGIHVSHSVDREEPGSVRVVFSTAAPGEAAVPRCSICCRQKWGDVWIDPFDIRRDSACRVMHTICEPCRDHVFGLRRGGAARAIRTAARRVLAAF